jgi:protein TonB
VVHAVSASYLRSERLSPPALGAAVLLHGLVAAALWGLSANRPLPPTQRLDPIDITIETPKPPPEPPKLPQQALPAPAFEGLRPPAPLESDKPTQVPTPPTPSREVAPPQTARAIEPPKPAARPHGIVVPPANPLPRPSPLDRPQQQREAATTPGPNQPTPSPFVNPADEYNRARAQDNYLYQVVSRLRGYRYYAKVTATEGVTVVRIVIARDGRLLDAEVVGSSGQPEMDRGVLAGVRAGSPYAPLPDDIKGSSATFRLPLVSFADQR